MSELSNELTSWASRRAIRMTFDAVDVFVAIHPRIFASQIRTFLRVACEEGLTVSDLAKRCGVKPCVISRHLRDLGTINRHHEPSLGLITVIQCAHGDRRQRHVILTEHGAAIARKMIAILKQSLG